MPSVLIEAMIEKYNYPVLNEETVDSFIKSNEECVLFFTENPVRFPESDDVAMILPEIIAEYGNRFNAAVIEQKSQRVLQARYGFTEWPTLVFIQQGEFLGAISRVQDWNDYILKINDFITTGPIQAPGIGINVKVENISPNHS